MIEPTTIFQRTQAGRNEIYQKSHGLTQSERLVLIMVDGTTSFEGIRTKLPVLTDERFNRALSNLQKKELVLEVFLPMGEVGPDEVESTVIDRFLQQDPLDPVTIIAFDPEEEFGDFAHIPQNRDTKDVSTEYEPPLSKQFDPLVTSTASWEPKLDEDTFTDIDRFAAQQSQTSAVARTAQEISLPYAGLERREGRERRQEAMSVDGLDGLHFHWGFMLIGVGFAFILGFVLGRVS